MNTPDTHANAPDIERKAPKTGAAVPRRPRTRSPASRAGTPAPQARKTRHAVFIDVENTSREDALLELLRTLALDPQAEDLELVAVGNWRAVAPNLARSLATLGARLVHSAPIRGVRDWSDLWIAAAAGHWIGKAQPGDRLDIVSDDRAFDAVGDLAAAHGVIFRRLGHARPRPRDGTERRRGALPATTRRRRPEPSPPPSLTGKEYSPTPRQEVEAPERVVGHPAPADEIVATIAELAAPSRDRWVNLDVLERALKAKGFVRPPGSPRLVTRLRNLKQVEVDAHGRVRLRTHPAPRTDHG